MLWWCSFYIKKVSPTSLGSMHPWFSVSFFKYPNLELCFPINIVNIKYKSISGKVSSCKTLIKGNKKMVNLNASLFNHLFLCGTSLLISLVNAIPGNLFCIKEKQKETLKLSKYKIKICPNRTYIFTKYVKE